MNSVSKLVELYLSNGLGITFLSSISLLAALFFSAVSVLLVWARDTGNVAILSPLSTSTVDIFESGPPMFSHKPNFSFYFFFYVSIKFVYSAQFLTSIVWFYKITSDHNLKFWIHENFRTFFLKINHPLIYIIAIDSLCW